MPSKAIQQAAKMIYDADALFIGAGAGMGVDSGLPDFRGDQGFWRAYPAFEELGLSFVELANPAWFRDDPALAWGFYGHRLHLYRDTTPHAGFDILKKWGDAKNRGYFVFTSNVDGQFQAANFAGDRLLECHGSIHHLQCIGGRRAGGRDAGRSKEKACGRAVWSADEERVDFDSTTFRAREPLPRCSNCAQLARPNIMMFNDFSFVSSRTDRQARRMEAWLETLLSGAQPKKLAIVECGAGTAVPSVRWQSERLARAFKTSVIRINPREAEGPAGTISVAMGAAKALGQIDSAMEALRPD